MRYILPFLGAVCVSALAVSRTSPEAVSRSTKSSDKTFYSGVCNAGNVSIRKEWRNLSTAEKKAYIKAEKCLMEVPALTDLTGVTSAFSDFQAIHHNFTDTQWGDIIHHLGQFLPFHRYFIHAHETLLRKECKYTGPMVWWDEAKDADAGDFFGSSMWTDGTGIGGDGSGSDHCLTTGPFADTTEYIGPLEAYSEYCLSRKFHGDVGVQYGSSTIVETCNAHDDYVHFYGCIDNYPHYGGHTAVGGTMSDIDSSPGEPAFFLHHNYIDRLWWKWQESDSANRLYAIGGPTLNITLNVEPATGWTNATLDYVLSSYGLLPNTTIETVMNIQGGYLCYRYDY